MTFSINISTKKNFVFFFGKKGLKLVYSGIKILCAHSCAVRPLRILREFSKNIFRILLREPISNNENVSSNLQPF